MASSSATHTSHSQPSPRTQPKTFKSPPKLQKLLETSRTRRAPHSPANFSSRGAEQLALRKEVSLEGMRMVHFRVGEIVEATKKEDFILAGEQDSASDTCEEDRAESTLESMAAMDYFGSPALSVESSWQVPDEMASEMSDWEVFCQNCAEPRYGDICELCGHDARQDACDFPEAPEFLPRRSPQQKEVILAYDERMNLHSKGSGLPHPERPDRLRAVMARLLSSGLADCCKQVPCREATEQELEQVHSKRLIEHNRELSSTASHLEDGESLSVSHDLYVNRHTYLCSRLAAGGSAEVTAAVMRKEVSAGAAIIRPPGHHAESGNSMGFCFFNNAAVAARTAQANGAQRVMIFDWDVHHGNGTQEIFDDDASVLYVSIHRHDGGSFYPGTGAASNVGHGMGEGFSVNIPWSSGGMGDEDYFVAMEYAVLPIAMQYKPDIIIISAGFDAAEGDPLGGCKVTPEGYAHLTSLLRRVAPLVMLLEGGYNLKSTAICTEACLKVLLGETQAQEQALAQPSPVAWLGIQETIHVHREYWPVLTRPSEIVRQWVNTPEKSVGAIGGRSLLCKPSTGLLRSTSVPKDWWFMSHVQNRPGKARRQGKLDWNQKFLHRSHESALQAIWKKRKRCLARRGSNGSADGSSASVGSLKLSSCTLEEVPSLSSSNSNSFMHRPRPNSLFGRTISRSSQKHRS